MAAVVSAKHYAGSFQRYLRNEAKKSRVFRRKISKVAAHRFFCNRNSAEGSDQDHTPRNVALEIAACFLGVLAG
jgi:hypothetical protein